MSLSKFLSSNNCAEILKNFNQLLDLHKLNGVPSTKFYSKCKHKLQKLNDQNNIRLLYNALDEKIASYSSKKRTDSLKVLVVGADVSGLRMSIEALLLGCQVVCIDSTSTAPTHTRYHLNTFCVDELVSLGALKKNMLGQSFFQSDTKQLRAILLRACLLLGVKVALNATYVKSKKKSNNIYTAIVNQVKPTRNNGLSLDFNILIDSCTSTFKECTFSSNQKKISTFVCICTTLKSTENSINHLQGFSWTRKSNKALFESLDKKGFSGLNHIRYMQNNVSHHCYMEMSAVFTESQIHGVLSCLDLSSIMTINNTKINIQKSLLSITAKKPMQTMGKCKGGADDGCLVMLCGRALSSVGTYSGNYLHVEWLSILDNGHILEIYNPDTMLIANILHYRSILHEFYLKILDSISNGENELDHLLLLGNCNDKNNGSGNEDGVIGGFSKSKPKTRYADFYFDMSLLSSSSKSSSSSFSSASTSLSSSLNVPSCITDGSSNAPSLHLQWYMLNEKHLTSERREHYDNLLYLGGILYIKCTSSGQLYIAEDTVQFSTTGSQIKQWKKYLHIQQVIGRKDYANWRKIKLNVKKNMKLQYINQITRSKLIHESSSYIAVIRLLDDLETALDPPKFGDAIIIFPNDDIENDTFCTRKRSENEMKLTRKETVDSLMTLFSTSGKDINIDSNGNSNSSSTNTATNTSDTSNANNCGASGNGMWPILRGYHKIFRYDNDAKDNVGDYDKLWRTLFDRAIVTTVDKKVYEKRKSDEKQFLNQRRINGEKYRRLAKEKREAEKNGGGGGGGMMSELKAMQQKKLKKSSGGSSGSGNGSGNGNGSGSGSGSDNGSGSGSGSSSSSSSSGGGGGGGGDNHASKKKEKRNVESKVSTSNTSVNQATLNVIDCTSRGEKEENVKEEDSNVNEPHREKNLVETSLLRLKSVRKKPKWKAIHSGWLLKRGQRWNSKLRHRLFVLQMDDPHRSLNDEDDLNDPTRTRLAYFTSEKKYTSSSPSGSILLKNIKTISKDINTTTRSVEKYGLYIKTKGSVVSSSRTYTLYCSSTKVRDEWEYVLRKTIRSIHSINDNFQTGVAANKGQKLYYLSLSSLQRTYTLPGSRLRNVRLIKRVDASQINELKEQSTTATAFFEENVAVKNNDDVSSSDDEEVTKDTFEGNDDNDDDEYDDDDGDKTIDQSEMKLNDSSTPIVSIPTLTSLRDVSGHIVRETSLLLQKVLELNVMTKQIHFNNENIIENKLSHLYYDIQKLKKLHTSLKTISNVHAKEMKQFREDSACLWWTPYGVLEKPNFKKCYIADVAEHEGNVKYQPRWFEVKGNMLHYYKCNPRDTRRKRIPKPRGSIDLSEVCSVRACRSSFAPNLSLELVTEHKQYILSAKSQKDFIRWSYKLQEAVNLAKGSS